jgi:hypothetical protein
MADVAGVALKPQLVLGLPPSAHHQWRRLRRLHRRRDPESSSRPTKNRLEVDPTDRVKDFVPIAQRILHRLSSRGGRGCGAGREDAWRLTNGSGALALDVRELGVDPVGRAP